MASITIKVDKRIITKKILNKLKGVNSPSTMIAIYNTLAKRCDPYVPMQEGMLANTVVVTDKCVRYILPYARYQYYGEVYGPNYPIKENGMIVGWWSPPHKHPTGRAINYSKEMHPLASSFWDKAMLRDHRTEFYQEVKDIIDWRLKQTNG